MLVGLVRQPRTRGLGPLELRVLLEVLVHEGPVGEVLEVAAAERVGRRHDLVTDGEQDVARGHLGEARLRAEVRRLDGLVPLQRRGAVHLDAQTLEDLDVVVELLVGGLDGGGGTGAPHAAHLGVDRHLLRGGGLLGRNNREVGASDDDTLERVEVVPRVDDLRHE